jgi:hypothetical protein
VEGKRVPGRRIPLPWPPAGPEGTFTGDGGDGPVHGASS